MVSLEKKKSGIVAFEEKKIAKSLVKVRASDVQQKEQPQQVKLLHEPRACDLSDLLKLLVFNVHGTLLYYSMISDKNPNPKLKPTFKITNVILQLVACIVQVGAEANQRSGSGKKNSDIIRETNRRLEQIYMVNEKTSIIDEEAIGDGKEPKG